MTPEAFVKRYLTRIRGFYHFTDVRNLDSIKTHGLLPYAELKRRGIAVPAPGGNEWSHEADEKFGLDEYVHLCLIDDHPMEFLARKDKRIERSTYLHVDPDVLSSEGVRFTAEVSNKSGAELLTLPEAAKTLDFEVVYDRTDWKKPEIQERRKAAKKYELLVPNGIATELIRFP